MLGQRCGSNSRFIITADVCAESPPSTQMFCVGQSGCSHKRRYRKKKFIILSRPRESHQEDHMGVSRELTQSHGWEAENRARTHGQELLLGAWGGVCKKRCEGISLVV